MPWKSWPEIVTEMEASDQFKATVHTVMSNYDTGRQDFALHAYTQQRMVGYQSFRDFVFMGKDEWQSRWPGVQPTDVGLEYACLSDEKGRPTTGVLLAEKDTPMRVRVSCHDACQFAELLQESKSQLYPAQVQEYQQHHSAGRDKQLPRAFGRPGSAPDLASLIARVQRFVEEKEAKEKEEQTLEKLVPEAQARPEDAEKEEAEEEHALDMAPPSQLPTGLVGKLPRGKAKAKPGAKLQEKTQKSKEKPKLKQTSQMPTVRVAGSEVASSKIDGDAASAVSSSSARSASSGTKSKGNSVEEQKGKARSAVSNIVLEEVLEQGKWGREIWQSGETLRSLQTKAPAAVETVLLEEHLKLAKAAQAPTLEM